MHREMVEGIHSGAVRLHEIVNIMLDMAKIDTQTLQLRAAPLSLPNLLQSIATKFSSALEERKLSLTLEGLDALPDIEADDDALPKVFYHLVMNAIKYTPDGGQISVSACPVHLDQAGRPEAVEVTVRDTGIGIDPRFQELIFAKFYHTGDSALHSSGTTKFKGGGPGLGLSIAKGIVTAHGGQIWAESAGYDEINCPGSTFHVVLPLRQARKEELLEMVPAVQPA
jgi:signal transduction histidine kinase